MRLVDPRLAQHGERTAYVLNKMLLFGGKYSDNRRRIFTVIALLHDFGAFKTDDIDALMRFEFDGPGAFAHSVYGYLYLHYLSPLREYADIVLYHHLPCGAVQNLDIRYRDVIQALLVADRLELLLRNGYLGSDYTQSFRDGAMSPAAMELFFRANRCYRIVEHLEDGSYKQELDAMVDGIAWGRDMTDRLLELLVFSLDFRNEDTVLRTARTVSIAGHLAGLVKLPLAEAEAVQYASYVYNLGMLGVPPNVTGKPGELSAAQYETVKAHVAALDCIIKPWVPDEIYRIARAHHERVDGSGYPLGQSGEALSRPMRVLMVADVIAAMSTNRADRPALARQEILNALEREAHQLGPVVTAAAMRGFDDMMKKVDAETEVFMSSYLDIKAQFGGIMEKLLVRVK